jgi:hypothetical protein
MNDMNDMHDTHDIERKIEAAHAPLSTHARERMWAHIETQIAKKQAVLSPYVFMSRITHVRALVPVTFALIVIVGLGGTAWASESARPGDALFPVDRAIETVRLSVVRDDATRTALTNTFTEERFDEIRELIDDSSLSDETLRSERIDEAVALTLALIDEAGVDDDVRITRLADTLRDANVEVRDDRIRARWDEEHTRVRYDDDDERIEYRTEDGERIRIEEKDGEVRVKSSDHSSDDEGTDVREYDSRDSSNDDSGDNSETSSSGSDEDTDVREDSDNRDEDRSGKGSGKDSEDDSEEDSSGSGNSGSGSGSDDE